MICKGFGSSEERGIPKTGSVIATTNQKINSLHEFFCVEKVYSVKQDYEKQLGKREEALSNY